MAGRSEKITIMTLDIQDTLDVKHYDDVVFVKGEKHAMVGNIAYPYKYFAAIQTCDENQLNEIMEDL